MSVSIKGAHETRSMPKWDAWFED